MSDGNFREFLGQAIKEAQEHINTPHHGHEVHNTLKSLLQIIQDFERALAESGMGNADARLMKRKYDQVRQERRNLEKQLEAIKEKVLPSIFEELKKIGGEAKQLAGHDDAAVKASAQNIQKANQQIVTLFAKM